MRLLNTTTLQLESHDVEAQPRYAILSHTWERDEVLYHDMTAASDDVWRGRQGAAKVLGFCDIAKKHGFDLVWIDTCCIDKSSSAELSEAINSMFQWYEDAKICYVYLQDVELSLEEEGFWDRFASCRWFTRGWTLQELLAPRHAKFYNKHWTFLSEKFSLASELSKIAGVPEILLRHGHASHPPSWTGHTQFRMSNSMCHGCGSWTWDSFQGDGLSQFSVAQRMSWAAKRTTTRKEDQAYCLFGVFNVNLPLLYGEGGKAFTRLQEEILRRCNDQSVLAYRELNRFGHGLFAMEPKSFGAGGGIVAGRHNPEASSQPTIELFRGGISLDVILCPAPGEDAAERYYLAILHCSMEDSYLSRPAMLIQAVNSRNKEFIRRPQWAMYRIDPPGHVTTFGDVGHGSSASYDIVLSHVELERIRLVYADNPYGPDPSSNFTVQLKSIVDYDRQPCVIQETDPQATNHNDKNFNQPYNRNFIVFHKPGYPRFCVVFGNPRWSSANIYSLHELGHGGTDINDDWELSSYVLKAKRALMVTHSSLIPGYEQKSIVIRGEEGKEDRKVKIKTITRSFLGFSVADLYISIAPVEY
ncbi:hypothetical protein S40293_00210 [Stachybotrys chartarum IBT 40293]|nr:hypothetical protein S40293_00210 [Stachybotrys chartarum IBT 40293]